KNGRVLRRPLRWSVLPLLVFWESLTPHQQSRFTDHLAGSGIARSVPKAVGGMWSVRISIYSPGEKWSKMLSKGKLPPGSVGAPRRDLVRAIGFGSGDNKHFFTDCVKRLRAPLRVPNTKGTGPRIGKVQSPLLGP